MPGERLFHRTSAVFPATCSFQVPSPRRGGRGCTPPPPPPIPVIILHWQWQASGHAKYIYFFRFAYMGRSLLIQPLFACRLALVDIPLAKMTCDSSTNTHLVQLDKALSLYRPFKIQRPFTFFTFPPRPPSPPPPPPSTVTQIWSLSEWHDLPY